MNALRSRLNAIARRRSGLSNGGALRLITIHRASDIVWSELTSRLRHLISYVPQQWDRHLIGKGHVEFAGNKAEDRGRAVCDDRVFDAVEVRTVRFPVIRVSRHRDPFVWLELDEFERAGADWVLAHVARRDMAGIDRGEPGCEKRSKGRLRSLQMKGRLVCGIGSDMVPIMVPR